MSRQELAAVQIIDENGSLTVLEILASTRLEHEELRAMVDAGLLEPEGPTEEWRFASRDLRRLRTAQRLMHDLDVNLSGAAVILDLIEERDRLRAQIVLLNRLLGDGK
jgi:chaperone modulatory protein CbpM